MHTPVAKYLKACKKYLEYCHDCTIPINCIFGGNIILDSGMASRSGGRMGVGGIKVCPIDTRKNFKHL